MNRIACTLLSMSVAFALTGCNRGTGIPGEALMDQVEVVELAPAENSAKRFEARIAADDRYSYRDHFTALLLSFGNDRCARAGHSVQLGGDNFPPDASRPEKAQALTMQFTCNLGILPNHRSVEPGTTTLAAFPRPEGIEVKEGWTSSGSGYEQPLDLANRLIGVKVREAYTEDCGERPMVIERIDTGTEEVPPDAAEPAQGTQSSAARVRMHVALSFRCLEQPPASDG